MSKAIFFNIPAQGHINPSLPVILAMVQRGEQIIYVNSEETRVQIEPTGAQFVAYPASSDARFRGLTQSGNDGDLPGNMLALVQLAEQLMPWVFDLLEREKPDYVIFDSLCSWAKQATERLGVRNAGILSTLALAPGAMPPMSPIMILNTLRQAIPRFPLYWQTARRMYQKFGVKGVGLFGAVMSTGQINIVFTSADFQPGADKLGSHFKFVGPSIAERPNSVEFPFEQITRQPVIYISLGTINNENLAFYRQCFEAFSDYPGQFILSAGKRTDLKTLEPIPANFIVRNFVPQLEVLQRTDLFITHGGMNSVHEGLWYNVPLVVIPQQVEQAIVSQQVVRTGAGVALGGKPPYGQVTVEELRHAIGHIMQHGAQYRSAAKKLGDSFRAAGGYQRAADELMRFGRLS